MMNNRKFNHEKRNLIFGALAKAKTVEQVEGVFEAFQIAEDNYIEKANALIEFQSGISYSSPSYQKLSDKNKYKNELAIFLTGEWKKARIYATGLNSYYEQE